MAARALMIQGTGSDVGKSLLVAGLCRAFAKRGVRVVPFKPQNMSNHAAVSDCGGGEIGRAQWLQAQACGVPTSVHMNPVLLKPEADCKSQLVVHGKRVGVADAAYYRKEKASLLAKVMESYQLLSEQAELVVIEGAGSPAEVNLREGDIANMGFAVPLGIPVVLVGDIERGGVIASLVGTHAILDEADRAAIAGFIINKFRGDVSLFDAGIAEIIKHTGWTHYGTVPYLKNIEHLPKEDGFSLSRHMSSAAPDAIRIAVMRIPHLANADDVDPLAAESDVDLRFVEAGQSLPQDVDLIIIPGTKSSTSDLGFIRAQGWDIQLDQYLKAGGKVLGICGGYQILGKTLSDPLGVDGVVGEFVGLGLLDVHTHYVEEKLLVPWQGHCVASGAAASGFHMRMGRTDGPGCIRPVFSYADGINTDGAVSENGQVMGSYIHGLFVEDDYRSYFLAKLRAGRKASGLSYRTLLDDALNQLAEVLELQLPLEALLGLARTASTAPQLQAG